MLEIQGESSGGFCDGLSRRNFLQIGSLAMGGIALPQLLQAEEKLGSKAQKQKSIIMIHLPGGPSHTDMWDIKDRATKEYRGEFTSIPTSVPGVRVCEHFPKLAKMWQDCTSIRSTVGQASDHNSFHCMTGRARRSQQPAGGWPSIGSVIGKVQGEGPNGTPPFIGFDSRAQGPGFLGAPYKYFAPNGKGKQDLVLNGIDTSRLDDRKAMLGSFDGFRRDVDNSRKMEGLDKFNQQAFGVITSSTLVDALDLKKEAPKRLAKYEVPKGYRDVKSFCTARRLVEAGARFVTLSWGSWDTHGNNFVTLGKQLPSLDIGLSALISDLKESGRLADTTICVWGEFGRTPRVNKNAGRDHWGRLCTLALAGGGLNMGQVIGKSSPKLEDPAERLITPQDVLASILKMFELDPKLQFLNHQGRPTYMVENGRPIKELF